MLCTVDVDDASTWELQLKILKSQNVKMKSETQWQKDLKRESDLSIEFRDSGGMQ